MRKEPAVKTKDKAKLESGLLRRVWETFDDRTGIATLVRPLLKHPVPPNTSWWYVFGSATLIAFVIQIVTGIALATVYVPSAGQAYDSLKYISEEATFGALVRGMHYFGASAMILFVGMHMIRVFLMGSYKFPREVNWLTGVLLLGLTVAMGFSGQLLRWDQTAVWSAIVGAEQAARVPLIGQWLARVVMGGYTIGTPTLSHFFAIHVFVFPGLLIALLAFHLYLVIKNGISERPKAGVPVDPATYREAYDDLLKRKGVPFWPDAAWRDVVFGIAAVAGVILLAHFVGAPKLSQPPDQALVHAQPRPDWYLLWYFAVLALLPHAVENYVIVLAPLLGALLLLSAPFISNRGERSVRRRPWAMLTVVFIIATIAALWHAGVQAHWSPDFDAVALPDRAIGATEGPVYDGAQVFNTKGCLYCHTIAGHGGKRGPDLSTIGDDRTADQLTIRILNGGYNMPAYANNITPEELSNVVAFLESRKAPQ